MVKLSVAIVAHPKRLGRAGRLQRATEADAVVVDRDGLGCWENSRRAWAIGVKGGSTHHCVLHDDARVCGNFRGSVVAALEGLGQPEELVCLMAGAAARPAVDEAVRRRLSWVTMDAGCWGIALVAPAAWIVPMLSWIGGNIAPGMPVYDRRIAAYLFVARRRPAVWLPVPSLVDHATEEPSLMGHGKIKGAALFIGSEISGAALDWSRPAEPPHVARRLSAFRQSLEPHAIGAELRLALKEESKQ